MRDVEKDEYDYSDIFNLKDLNFKSVAMIKFFLLIWLEKYMVNFFLNNTQIREKLDPKIIYWIEINDDNFFFEKYPN